MVSVVGKRPGEPPVFPDAVRITFTCEKCRLSKPASDVDIGMNGAQWCRACVRRVARAMHTTMAAVREWRS
jgi:xanthine dehydrogenase iron-sulfur cluster and FAD-binding subunit A